MTYDKESAAFTCDGCLGHIMPGHLVSFAQAGAVAHAHYHRSCWLTGWYTGIEPKGEWPTVPREAVESDVPPDLMTMLGEAVRRPLDPGAFTGDHDPVNHPPHYRWLPNGIEVIDITENFGFLLGNVLKYVMRADHKGKPIEDLKKAAWYLDREIAKRESGE